MAECDFDPIRQMIYVAKHPKASLELRGKMGAELAKYRHPQLRSHEHSGEGGGPIAQEIVVRRLDR